MSLSDELKQEKEDLRLLYDINVDDIKEVKRQQWAIAYNVLLVYAALL
jgi:hypothetical protein